MSDNTQRLIPANTTLLQPGSRFFRISDALNYQVAVNQTAQGAIDNTNTNVTALQGQVTALEGTVSALEGQIGTLQSQVATLQAQVTALTAFQASFNYIQTEVSTGTYYLNGATIYRRSFVMPGTMLNTALTVASFAHNVANVGYIVFIQAIASLYQGQSLPMAFINMAQAPSINTGLSVWGDQTNIYVAVGNTTFGTYTPIATMWYTATDR